MATVAERPTSPQQPARRKWMTGLLSPERLFFAALVGSLVSFVVHLQGVLNPGPPQSTVLATKTIPFFNHMLVSFYAAVLAWVGGARFDDFVRKHPQVIVWGIIVSTIATGVQQWFFPNY